MALLRCRGCEGTFKIHKGSRIAYCPYCGMKHILPDDDVKFFERTANTLKRGFMLLEDGEFEKADECFDRVLDTEPENGRAYLGRLMASVEARNDFELAERLKDGIDDLDAWKNIDVVNALLSSTLQFAPDEMRSVFNDDYHDALFLMKRGSYKKALAAFWSLRNFHPDAVEKAKECSRLMHTTVDAVLNQENQDYEAALFREDFRSGLEKQKPVQAALPQLDNVSQNSKGEYEIRNTRSMPKWLMWLLITVFCGFFVWVFWDLFVFLNAH